MTTTTITSTVGWALPHARVVLNGGQCAQNRHGWNLFEQRSLLGLLSRTSFPRVVTASTVPLLREEGAYWCPAARILGTLLQSLGHDFRRLISSCHPPPCRLRCWVHPAQTRHRAWPTDPEAPEDGDDNEEDGDSQGERKGKGQMGGRCVQCMEVRPIGGTVCRCVKAPRRVPAAAVLLCSCCSARNIVVPWPASWMTTQPTRHEASYTALPHTLRNRLRAIVLVDGCAPPA